MEAWCWFLRSCLMDCCVTNWLSSVHFAPCTLLCMENFLLRLINCKWNKVVITRWQSQQTVVCWCWMMQNSDANEASNPLLGPVDSLSDGTVMMKGNMTLINLNLAGVMSTLIYEPMIWFCFDLVLLGKAKCETLGQMLTQCRLISG